MDTQTITQTINLLVAPGVPNTGIGPTDASPPLIPLAIGATLLIASLLAWYFLIHRSHNSNRSKLISKLLPKLGARSLTILVLLGLITALVSHLPNVSAAPTLSLGTDQNTIHVTVPQGGGTTTNTTTLTSGTANASGYTLTASLNEPEPGIGIKLKGGNVTTDTTLNPSDSPLTLKTTTEASTNDATEVTLDFTIDSTVTSGTKELKLNYTIADNTVEFGATLQSFTTSDCSALPIYTGTNEEAVISLTDTRGDNQIYQVAKLADGHCWMLENLKLGSTTGTLTLTPSDTNVASNFTLPQLTTTGTADFDNPGAYGPVTGDTGEGETNYGYLYNWPAVTAGESRTSHTEADGDAPYSICPANWRLPTVGFSYDEETDSSTASGDYSNLDIAFGGTGQYADSGVSIAQWQHNGPFKGVFSGLWDGEFGNQGGVGVFWSASARPDSADYAFVAGFNEAEVFPADGSYRNAGFSVRCLLQ